MSAILIGINYDDSETIMKDFKTIFISDTHLGSQMLMRGNCTHFEQQSLGASLYCGRLFRFFGRSIQIVATGTSTIQKSLKHF